ncbi:ATP-binding protein [Methanoculleus sp. MH98A]|uniref:ATP-binding protein n=1 Tax=Methanoculleus sp. MH98A TaxID=1495314 RepID=UPI0012DCC46F|nr:ATP-binding protein [Methanoculleus sp. MH98A]
MNKHLHFHPGDSDLAPAILVLVSSAIAVIVSLYSLNSGLYFIFQNFFYLPIVLACFFYARRGFVFSVAISCLYVVLIFSYTRELEHISGAFMRFILFIFIAAVISTLSASQQRTKEALAASEQNLNHIINFLPDATFAVDLEGRIVVWNHAMERLTGIGHGEVVGKGNYEHAYCLFGKRFPLLIDAILKNNQELLREKYPNVRNIDGVLSGDIEVDNLYGRRVVLWAIATPLRNHQGEVVGAIESARDVTQAYDTRAQLEQANTSLTLVNTKLQLISKLTQHDLLNTIQVLSGYVEIVRQAAPGTQPLTEYVGEINALTHTLCEQVEFARDYQNIGIKEPVWQNLQDMIARGLATVTPAGVTITTVIDPVEVYADPLLERVIYNLAMNAVNHGKQTTRIAFSTQKKGSGMVIVCEDDGVGVPEHLKEAIFKREYYKNNGYGLFLARVVLSITNLTIRETGTPGKGARFEILVPEGSYRRAGDGVASPGQQSGMN